MSYPVYLFFLARWRALTQRRFFFLRRRGGTLEMGVISRASNKDGETAPRGDLGGANTGLEEDGIGEEERRGGEEEKKR